MTMMTVYTMSDIYKKADEYAKSLGGERVDYVEIGVLKDGGILVMVHYSDNKRKEYLGSFGLIFNQGEQRQPVTLEYQTQRYE